MRRRGGCRRWSSSARPAGPGGLDAGQVLTGALGSWRELARALAGDWNLIADWKPLAGPWSDAESSAAIGLVALALAGIIPARKDWRRAWLGLWLAALASILLSLRPVMEPLLRLAPLAGIFHDPRRWLGVTQWLLILNAGIGAGSLWPARTETEAAAPRFSWLRFFAGAGAGSGGVALAQWEGAPHLTLFQAALGLSTVGVGLLATQWTRFTGLARGFAPVLLILALGLLGQATWVTTDLKTIETELMPHPEAPPLILRGGLHPGQRFFTLDWIRSASYDYTRRDLTDWALPNLAMLWGVEDLGGYEPAQSERYRAFMKSIHAAEPWRQPFAQHFGLVQNPLAREAFDQANVRAAIFPRWGVPMFFQPTRAGREAVGPLPTLFHREF